MRRLRKGRSISGKARSHISDILRPLSPVQQIAFASATYAFLFTIVSDLITLFLAPLVSTGAIVGFPIALALTSVGVILPSYILLRSYSEVRERKEQMREPLHTPTIAAFVPMGIGVLSVSALLMMVLVIPELIFPSQSITSI